MSEIDVRYPTFKSLPGSVKAYIAVATSIYLPLSIFIFKQKPFLNINWSDFLIYLIIASALCSKPLLMNRQGETIDTSTLIWVAAIFLFNPEQVFIIVLLSHLVGDILSRTKPWAYILNIIELPISYYMGSLVFNTLKPNQPFFENLIASIPAILIGIITALCINYTLHLIVYNLLFTEDSFNESLKQVTSGILLYEVSQIPIGILLALTYHFQHFSIILFLLPILFYYIAHDYQSRVRQKEREAVEEKRRIEQDAHDRIYNRLGALAKKAELALDSPAQMEPTLNLIKDDLQKSVADLQNIIRGEVEVVEEPEEDYLQKELAQICEAFKNKSDVKLKFYCDESLVANIAPQHFWHLQCIIEECLNNIHKHSKASEASISFKEVDNSLLISIADDGVGMKALSNEKSIDNRRSGLGLPGMQERAKKIGAEISVGANNGSGTKIELRLPRSASPRSQ